MKYQSHKPISVLASYTGDGFLAFFLPLISPVSCLILPVNSSKVSSKSLGLISKKSFGLGYPNSFNNSKSLPSKFFSKFKNLSSGGLGCGSQSLSQPSSLLYGNSLISANRSN